MASFGFQEETGSAFDPSFTSLSLLATSSRSSILAMGTAACRVSTTVATAASRLGRG